jgi:hypothetical protein
VDCAGTGALARIAILRLIGAGGEYKATEEPDTSCQTLPASDFLIDPARSAFLAEAPFKLL